MIGYQSIFSVKKNEKKMNKFRLYIRCTEIEREREREREEETGF